MRQIFLYNVILNQRVQKIAGALVAGSLLFVILGGALEIFCKIRIPSAVAFSLGGPLLAALFGLVIFGGPAVSLYADANTASPANRNPATAMIAILNFMAGMAITGMLFGAMHSYAIEHEYPWLSFFGRIAAGCILGTLYGAIAKSIIKWFFKL